MSAPFFKFGAFGDEMSLVVAVVIGIGFGFFLERAGFGSARKLTDQFYLKDLAVLKVMFTAIVTAMLGLFYLAWLGLVDLSLVYYGPTYLVPQIVGGLILGIGFVIGGYCPGTSMVALATGKVDALFFVLGVAAGIFGYGEAWPLVQGFANSTNLGELTLPQVFGLRYGLVVFLVVLMALAAFKGAEVLARSGLPRRLVLGALVLGALAVFGRPDNGGAVTIHPQELATLVQKEVDHVSVQELNDWILQGRSDYRLIDLRDAQAYAAYHIPAAENLPITDLPGDALARNEKIVLYSEGGIHSAQAWFLLKAEGYRGVYILRGGLDEWNDQILHLTPAATVAAQPGPSPSAAPAVKPPSPPAAPAAPTTPPKKKKKEGC